MKIKVALYTKLIVCPGRMQAWYMTNVGMRRKPIQDSWKVGQTFLIRFFKYLKHLLEVLKKKYGRRN